MEVSPSTEKMTPRMSHSRYRAAMSAASSGADLTLKNFRRPSSMAISGRPCCLGT